MKKTEPSISVIVPVYKVENYLPRCIESILNQTFTDFELILVNDGSPDRCGEICDEYAKKDERIIVIHQENSGVSLARNRGIETAKGIYIQFIDSDDWIESSALEVLQKTAVDGDYDVVVSNFYIDDDKGTITKCKVRYAEGEYNNNEMLNLLFEGKEVPNVWNKLWKRSLIIDNKIESPEGIAMGEDLDVTLRLIYHAKKIIKINDCFLHYIHNENSITNACRSEKLDEIVTVANNNAAFFINKIDREQYSMYLKGALENIGYVFNIYSKINWQSKRIHSGVVQLKEYLVNTGARSEIKDCMPETKIAMYLVLFFSSNLSVLKYLWNITYLILKVKNKINYEFKKNRTYSMNR